LSPIVAPFYQLQAERRQEAEEGLAERKAEFELADEEFKRLRRRKDAGTDELAAALMRRDEAEVALEAPAQLVVDDLTPEALANDLAVNPRLLIASAVVRHGLDPVRAARQMGHARPSITLDIYAHEFEEARGKDDIVERLTAAFGA
jgi:Protein of unknown function (DUF3987)